MYQRQYKIIRKYTTKIVERKKVSSIESVGQTHINRRTGMNLAIPKTDSDITTLKIMYEEVSGKQKIRNKNKKLHPVSQLLSIKKYRPRNI